MRYRRGPRARYWISIVVLGVMAWVSAPPASAQPAADQESQARALFDQERYAEAANALRAVLERDPGNRTANILLSFALARAGDVRAALEQTRRALDRVPGNVKLQLLLAGLLSQSDATRNEALDQYARILERDPENLLARLGVAETFRALGRPLDALQNFAILAERVPDDPRYAIRVGQLYGSLGDLQQARRYFERAHALSPTNADAVRSLAILGDVDDRPDDAVRYYRELVTLYPADIFAQIGLRTSSERLAETRLPMALDELEKVPLETYLSAVPANSKQLQHRKEQLDATRARSVTRFLPSFFFAPSWGRIDRIPKPNTTDETQTFSFSFGWNLADLVADPFAINITGMKADLESIQANLMNEVTATYYQRLQAIVQYRQLQRALALEPQNTQIRVNKQSGRYAILNLTERLRILTGIP